MKSKYINIVLVIILLAVAGFFAYSYSQNNKGGSPVTNTEPNKNENETMAANTAATNTPANNTAVETPSGWKTYATAGLNFSYPPELSPVGTKSENSAIGTYDQPVKGVYAGPYVLVVAIDQATKQA